MFAFLPHLFLPSHCTASRPFIVRLSLACSYNHPLHYFTGWVPVQTAGVRLDGTRSKKKQTPSHRTYEQQK
ncbi:hypothetical protein L873DRAFT_1810249 [Choiromyces venosus 120613-1]|uniref:Uncharacterized protein n=1 Tax=Choiromyces venosus 120613-1 TaxID=1336337 RepID=A0A3N4JJL6_9PEZI|nr:hypothetical protein L873DRAFT_1810249 [Choiromyces venosus 120613-1]